MGFYRIADINIEISARYPDILEACAPYEVAPCEAELSLSVSDSEIAREAAASGMPEGYCEGICLLRALNEQLPRFDALILHSAAFTLDGRGFALCAPSGTGKSTHLRLLRELLGERCDIVNGDKPIVRFIDGIPYIYGSPWRGKEKWGKNRRAALEGIVFIHRSQENTIRTLAPREALTVFMRQIPLPRTDSVLTERSVALADKLISGARLYSLGCNISPCAASLSSKTLLGEYHEN